MPTDITLDGIRIGPQDLSAAAPGTEDDGRMYHHDGSSSISLVNGESTSTRGYYVWDGTSGAWRPVASNTDKLDGKDASYFAAVSEDETIDGSWTFQYNVDLTGGFSASSNSTLNGNDLKGVGAVSEGSSAALVLGNTPADMEIRTGGGGGGIAKIRDTANAANLFQFEEGGPNTSYANLDMDGNSLTSVFQATSADGGELRLGKGVADAALATAGAGGGEITVYDSANSNFIAEFNEGGTVRLPNGPLKAQGVNGSGHSIELSGHIKFTGNDRAVPALKSPGGGGSALRVYDASNGSNFVKYQEGGKVKHFRDTVIKKNQAFFTINDTDSSQYSGLVFQDRGTDNWRILDNGGGLAVRDRSDNSTPFKINQGADIQIQTPTNVNNNPVKNRGGTFAGYQSTNKAIGSNVVHLDFAENVTRNQGFTKVNNGEIDVDTAGTYKISVNVRLKRTSGTGRSIEQAAITINGVKQLEQGSATTYIRNAGDGNENSISFETAFDLSAGDRIAVDVELISSTSYEDTITNGNVVIERI